MTEAGRRWGFRVYSRHCSQLQYEFGWVKHVGLNFGIIMDEAQSQGYERLCYCQFDFDLALSCNLWSVTGICWPCAPLLTVTSHWIVQQGNMTVTADWQWEQLMTVTRWLRRRGILAWQYRHIQVDETDWWLRNSGILAWQYRHIQVDETYWWLISSGILAHV